MESQKRHHGQNVVCVCVRVNLKDYHKETEKKTGKIKANRRIVIERRKRERCTCLLFKHLTEQKETLSPHQLLFTFMNTKRYFLREIRGSTRMLSLKRSIKCRSQLLNI